MKIRISLLLTALSLSVFAQTPAFNKNAELGRGINLGNMFEAPSEEAWGNPLKDYYTAIIAGKGFDHVRIPIRWEPEDRSMADSPYTIDETFLQRIQHVVDLAIENKMHAVVNMHHHEALFENPEEQKPRFLAMWSQIATYFADYSDSLVFEILNEPNGNLTAEKWNVFLADALQTIRRTNPSRFILIATAEYGGLGGLSKLQLPNDDRLILTIHYYNPFSFTHQGAEWIGPEADQWLETEWNDTEPERQMVQADFAPAIQFSKTNNIPIHVGEFGAYNRADMYSRVRWTTYLARYFESQNFSWAYWEFSAGFGIFRPLSNTFRHELIDALLHNELAEPTPVTRKALIKTDFEQDGDMGGWNLYNSSGASSSGSVSDGGLTLSITNTGTESWHIQLVLNNLNLENGKTYEVQLRAKGTDNRPISASTGMSQAPWNSYSGNYSFNMTTEFQTYSFSFQMQNDTDIKARLVLNLGYSDSEFILDEIAVYEISIGTESSALKEKKSFFYPNPTDGMINFSKADSTSQVLIYSLTGQLILQKEISADQQVDLNGLPKGRYLIRWPYKGTIQSSKLIKQN
ncbi:cellulase family glycosylhydrolase [Sunxiuqinia sp. sy24]|uniref:cellulase family glycosylhydrolase n=1 Tax=Sunxiuqinia sp. sy24 TaxID=3461495 RepID=UPI0040453308